MDIFDSNAIISFLLGIGLFASARFRIFLPLFAWSVDAHFGQDLLQINENRQRLGYRFAIITFGTATPVALSTHSISLIKDLFYTIAISCTPITLPVILLYGIYRFWKWKTKYLQRMLIQRIYLCVHSIY